ncbi:MAG TPA: LEPR-XLL domain-containing protein [Pirellulales bacterium]|jgi:uncharacterized delta-60 repeat protein|nr:LEPR-XLL domain-containing protein [Pirellulales bacterium]
MSSSKAICVDRLLRFEVLEDRMLMSASTSTTPADQPQVPGLSQAVAQEPDGTILVAGIDNGGLQIARYNSDGTLNTSFGAGGVTSSGNLNLEEVQQIHLESDGSFYVLGQANLNNGQLPTTTLIHVEADGSVDTSFGDGGELSLNDPAVLPSVAFQNDGKILVGASVTGSATLERFNADGTLDTTFHFDAARLDSDLLPGAPMTVDAQGRILLIGDSSDGLHLIRLNSDGSVDTTFGQSGNLTAPFDSARGNKEAITVQPDGKILLATTGVDQSTGAAEYELLRFNDNGSLDTSFNGTGIVTADIPNETIPTDIAGMIVQSDGKIVVTSATSPVTGFQSGLSAATFYADGSLDTNYGDGGFASEPSALYMESGVALGSNDSLLVVGADATSSSAAGPFTFDLVVVDADHTPQPPASAPAQPEPTTVESVSSQVTQALPVIMAAQVVTLNVPAATIVTNPSVSTAIVSAQQPIAPIASAAASLDSSNDDASTADDTSADEFSARLAAIDLAFAL